MMARIVSSLALALGIAGGAAVADDGQNEAVAIFAGGCFWCVEADFDKVAGVTRTVSGYTGGHVENPSYREVVAGGTGHREAVRIHFDPETVSYDRLLHIFWRSVDPTDAGGQFCDRGMSYTTAIYAMTPQQREKAEASRRELEESGKLPEPIVTEIAEAGPFYEAEAYHQNYYKENPLRYKFYRWNCGRDARLEQLWGDEAMAGIESS